MSDRFWRQGGYSVRCEWGRVGAERVGGDGAIVLVDVLSFTTSVSVMVAFRASVHAAYDRRGLRRPAGTRGTASS